MCLEVRISNGACMQPALMCCPAISAFDACTSRVLHQLLVCTPFLRLSMTSARRGLHSRLSSPTPRRPPPTHTHPCPPPPSLRLLPSSQPFLSTSSNAFNYGIARLYGFRIWAIVSQHQLAAASKRTSCCRRTSSVRTSRVPSVGLSSLVRHSAYTGTAKLVGMPW